jgi:hypothetical protein
VNERFKLGASALCASVGFRATRGTGQCRGVMG